MNASAGTGPTPYTISWQNQFPATFKNICPTTTSSKHATCGIWCVADGNAAITVVVHDANGQLVGADTDNFLCVEGAGWDPWNPTP